jgi:hypothetical protein
MPMVAATEGLQKVLIGLLTKWNDLKNEDVRGIDGPLNQPLLMP